MAVTLYHNPKCSKSRQTLQLLEERNIKPEIIEYLKDPPTVDHLRHILKLLGRGPRDLMRKKEDEYKEFNLDNPSISEDELLEFMVNHPVLIERPIVLTNGKAALGRPPENVLEIL